MLEENMEEIKDIDVVAAEIYHSISDTINLAAGQKILHISKIYKDEKGNKIGKWIIDTEDLKRDIFLQAGRPNEEKAIYIFKIKANTYSAECFRPHQNMGILPQYHINQNKRDICINIGDNFRETLEEKVNFAKHIINVICYGNYGKKEVIINPNDDENNSSTSLETTRLNDVIEYVSNYALKDNIQEVFSYIKNSGASLVNCEVKQGIAHWVINSCDLNNDLYLLAKTGGINNPKNNVFTFRKDYIFKIRSGTYNSTSFAPHNLNWFLIDHDKRNIWINLNNNFMERGKEEVDFSKHLWATLDYKTRDVIINLDYDATDNDAFKPLLKIISEYSTLRYN